MGIVIFTFDIEDFINPISIMALKKILLLLKKYSIKGIFFITGHMAEKIRNFPYLIELLAEHEIGYHSSSHSVRPIITEFTDTPYYEKAVENSLEREVSHINPLNGEIEGIGGIKSLQKLFPNKKITYFRAPGMCWTPPHLGALKKLGITYDFSSGLYGDKDLSNNISYYKGMIFFPFRYLMNYVGEKAVMNYLYNNLKIIINILTHKITCLLGHEWEFVLSKPWDFIYFKSNPSQIKKIQPLTNKEITKKMIHFEILLKALHIFQKLRLIHIINNIHRLKAKKIHNNKIDVHITYQKSMIWSINFMNYRPKYIFNHFRYYFNESEKL